MGSAVYATTMGSDVHRDGMYLALYRAGHEHEGDLAEVFYSDADGTMTFTAKVEDIPLDAIEALIAEARRRLPPRAASASASA